MSELQEQIKQLEAEIEVLTELNNNPDLIKAMVDKAFDEVFGDLLWTTMTMTSHLQIATISTQTIITAKTALATNATQPTRVLLAGNKYLIGL